MEIVSLSDWLNAIFEVLARFHLDTAIQAFILFMMAFAAFKLIFGRGGSGD